MYKEQLEKLVNEWNSNHTVGQHLVSPILWVKDLCKKNNWEVDDIKKNFPQIKFIAQRIVVDKQSLLLDKFFDWR